MFTKRRTEAQIAEITTAIKQKLMDDRVDPDEFIEILDKYTTLQLAVAPRYSHKVSPDVLASIVANLVGIAMILHHERVGVVTSKALAFVHKLR